MILVHKLPQSLAADFHFRIVFEFLTCLGKNYTEDQHWQGLGDFRNKFRKLRLSDGRLWKSIVHLRVAPSPGCIAVRIPGDCNMKAASVSLEEVGRCFWGGDWEAAMASRLEVSKETITAWVHDPAAIPPGTEDVLRMIGQGRLEEIEVMLAKLARRA